MPPAGALGASGPSKQPCSINEIANPKGSEFEQAPDLDAPSEMAQAFLRLTDESRALSLLSRYEARLERAHSRALNTLRELREHPIPAPLSEPKQPPTAIKPEPRPAPPQAEVPVPEVEKKSAKTNPRPVVPFPVSGAKD